MSSVGAKVWPGGRAGQAWARVKKESLWLVAPVRVRSAWLGRRA